MEKEKISIIMGIYNCEKYLKESIESIINQTYTNWRLIMCDDGSTDSTLKIAQMYEEKYKDKIIVLINKRNMGLNYTLNKCLSVANGEYIARQDADDISISTRFEKEINFLEKNNEYSFVSCNMIHFDETGDWGKNISVEKPENNDFVYGTPFCHAAVMIRKECIDDVKGYSVDDKLLRVEDYHLWFKLYSKGYKGYNIQEFLYKMRDDKSAIKRRTWKNRINEYYVRKIGYRMLNIPYYKRINKFKPLLLGLLPNRLYIFLHKKKLN